MFPQMVSLERKTQKSAFVNVFKIKSVLPQLKKCIYIYTHAYIRLYYVYVYTAPKKWDTPGQLSALGDVCGERKFSSCLDLCIVFHCSLSFQYTLVSAS